MGGGPKKSAREKKIGKTANGNRGVGKPRAIARKQPPEKGRKNWALKKKKETKKRARASGAERRSKRREGMATAARKLGLGDQKQDAVEGGELPKEGAAEGEKGGNGEDEGGCGRETGRPCFALCATR